MSGPNITITQTPPPTFAPTPQVQQPEKKGPVPLEYPRYEDRFQKLQEDAKHIGQQSFRNQENSNKFDDLFGFNPNFPPPGDGPSDLDFSDNDADSDDDGSIDFTPSFTFEDVDDDPDIPMNQQTGRRPPPPGPPPAAAVRREDANDRKHNDDEEMTPVMSDDNTGVPGPPPPLESMAEFQRQVNAQNELFREQLRQENAQQHASTRDEIQDVLQDNLRGIYEERDAAITGINEARDATLSDVQIAQETLALIKPARDEFEQAMNEKEEEISRRLQEADQLLREVRGTNALGVSDVERQLREYAGMLNNFMDAETKRRQDRDEPDDSMGAEAIPVTSNAELEDLKEQLQQIQSQMHQVHGALREQKESAPDQKMAQADQLSTMFEQHSAQLNERMLNIVRNAKPLADKQARAKIDMLIQNMSGVQEHIADLQDSLSDQSGNIKDNSAKIAENFQASQNIVADISRNLNEINRNNAARRERAINNASVRNKAARRREKDREAVNSARALLRMNQGVTQLNEDLHKMVNSAPQESDVEEDSDSTDIPDTLPSPSPLPDFSDDSKGPAAPPPPPNPQNLHSSDSRFDQDLGSRQFTPPPPAPRPSSIPFKPKVPLFNDEKVGQKRGPPPSQTAVNVPVQTKSSQPDEVMPSLVRQGQHISDVSNAALDMFDGMSPGASSGDETDVRNTANFDLGDVTADEVTFNPRSISNVDFTSDSETDTDIDRVSRIPHMHQAPAPKSNPRSSTVNIPVRTTNTKPSRPAPQQFNPEIEPSRKRGRIDSDFKDSSMANRDAFDTAKSIRDAESADEHGNPSDVEDFATAESQGVQTPTVSASGRRMRLYKAGKALFKFQNESHTTNMNGINKETYDYELEKMMQGYPKFIGVFMSDELHDALEKGISEVGPVFGLIMNLATTKAKFGTHWVSIYVDVAPDGRKQICYYDSLNDKIPSATLRELKKFAQFYSPTTKIKFKVNSVQQQAEDSNRCGYFAVQFLQHMFKTKGDFAESSSFHQALSEWRMAHKESGAKAHPSTPKFGYL